MLSQILPQHLRQPIPMFSSVGRLVIYDFFRVDPFLFSLLFPSILDGATEERIFLHFMYSILDGIFSCKRNANYWIRFIEWSTSCHVSVRFDKDHMPYAVSAYFQFAHLVQGYLEQLGQILTILGNVVIIIGVDLNPKSPMCSSDRTNIKSRLIEDIVTT